MKYRFEVHYMNKCLKKFRELITAIDLEARFYAIKEIITFTCDKNLTLDEIKDNIIEAFEYCDYEVVHIEGGLVE